MGLMTVMVGDFHRSLIGTSFEVNYGALAASPFLAVDRIDRLKFPNFEQELPV